MKRLALLSAVLCVAPGAAALAAEPILEAQELGVDGELYRVWSGTYGDLFDDGQFEADTPALAVDVVAQEGGTTRRLVPGTGGDQVESHPAVVFDDASASLFLLWQSRVPNGSNTLFFVDFQVGGGFSRPIAILSDHESFETTPLLEASRSSFAVTGDDGVRREVLRTVLHVIWVQAFGDSFEQLRYMPIVLLGGGGVSAAEPIVPADLLAPGVTSPPPAIPAALAREPDLDQGADSQSFILTLADRDAGRLLSVRVRAIPGEIGLVADKARHVIIGTGLKGGTGLKVGMIAVGASVGEQVEAEVVEAARDLHPAVAAYLGRAARDVVEELGTGPVAVEKARHVIIGTGSRTGGSGVFDETFADTILEVEVVAEGVQTPITNVVEVAVLADRTLPGGIGPGARAFSSPTGSSAVVLWNEVGAVAFRIADGDGDWGTVHRLPVTSASEEEQIIRSLRERVRRR